MNVGISFAVSQIISWITELVNAKKEAEEVTRQEIETALDNAEAVESEIKALDSLNSSYLEAKTKSSDLTEQKKALSDVQKKLAESLNMEKQELDGLIDGYGDYIEVINNASTAKSQAWLNENKYAIDKAQEEYDKAKNNNKLIQSTISEIDQLVKTRFGGDYNKAQNSLYEDSDSAEEYLRLTSQLNQLMTSDHTLLLDMKWKNGNWKKLQSEIQKEFQGNAIVTDDFEHLYINGDLEKRLEILNWIKTNANTFEIDGSQYQMVEDQIDKISKSLELYNQSQQYTVDNTRRQQLETIGFYEKVNEYEQALGKASNGENFAERYENLKKSQDIYDELLSLDGLTESETDYINELKDSFDEVIFQAKNTSSAINTIFNEYKTDTYDSIKENVETVNNAIEKILNNESLDETELLSLAEIDSDLLNGLIKTTGGYTLSLESLNEAKKKIVTSAKEENKVQKENIELLIESEKATLALNEAKRKELEEELKYAATTLSGNGMAKILSDEIADINNQINNSNEVIDTLYNTLSKFEILEDSLQSFANSVDKLSSDTLLSIMTNQFDAKISEIDKQISELEDEKDLFQEKIDRQQELKESIEDRYDTEINKLKELNEEKENENKLEEARQRLEKAGQRTLRVWRSGVGWVWEQDQEELKEARQEYDSALLDDKINKLEKAKEEELKIADDRIKELEDYSEEYYDNQIKQLKNSKEFYEDSRQEYTDYVELLNNKNAELLASETGLTISLEGEYEKRKTAFENWKRLYNDAYNRENQPNDYSGYKPTYNSFSTPTLSALQDYADSVLNNVSGFMSGDLGAVNALADPLRSSMSQAKTVFNNMNNQTVNFRFGDITTNNPIDFMKQLESYLRQAGIKSIIK